MKKSAIAIAAAVAAIVLVWVVVFVSSSDDQSAVEQTSIEAPEPAIEEQVAEPNVEPPPEPSAAPTPPAAAPPAPQRIPSDQLPPDYQSRPEKIGPVAELKAAYESDPRDPEAGATEERIRDHLKQVEISPELVRSVSCVKSVCKLEMNWKSEERHGYMIAMMNLISHISEQVAADPVGDNEGQEVHPIDVYVSRVVPRYVPPGAVLEPSAPAGQ